MRRLYFMFPARAAGLALVNLRLAVILCLISMMETAAQEPLSVIDVLLCLLGLCLVLGLFTPLVCAILVAIEALSSTTQSMTPLEVGVALMITAALGILGPSAYSLDARLFGRRRIPTGED